MVKRRAGYARGVKRPRDLCICFFPGRGFGCGRGDGLRSMSCVGEEGLFAEMQELASGE